MIQSASRLQAIHEIEQLKHRYLRLLDTKSWDELGALFTADAVTDYGDGKYAFTGREEIVGFLRKSLGVPGCISVHTVCQPEFNRLTDDHAEVTWGLRDRVIYLEHDVQIEGAAYYHDTFRKEDGEWRIAKTGYERQYEQRFSRSSLRGLKMTANRFPLEGEI